MHSLYYQILTGCSDLFLQMCSMTQNAETPSTATLPSFPGQVVSCIESCLLMPAYDALYVHVCYMYMYIHINEHLRRILGNCSFAFTIVAMNISALIGMLLLFVVVVNVYSFF